MASPNDNSVVPFPHWLWVFVGAWLVLTVGAVVWAVPHQEQHLTEQAATALSGSTMTASFEGRDATLSGAAPSEVEVERAKATVLTQRGVRTVRTGALAVAADGTERGELVALEAEFADRVVTVTGIVPDAATEDAITAAIEGGLDGATVVVDVDVYPSVASPAWVAVFGEAIGSLDGLQSGVVSFADGTVTIEGEVASEDLRTELEASLAATVASSAAISGGLVVVEGAPPRMNAVVVDGMLQLDGDMPDSQAIDALEGNAALAYGPANVTSALHIGVVGGRSYLTALPELFAAMRDVVSWQAELVDDTLVVTGVAPDEATAADAAAALAVMDEAGLSVTVQFEIDPAALATSLTKLLSGVPNFELGGAELSGAAKARLDDAIVLLLENSEIVVVVEGHTDDTGGEDRNLELSRLRAQAVVDYLIAGGITSSRLSAVGLGETEPVASNDTPAGRAANRRIEFVVTVEEGQ